jgi:putative DNA primase/helicase
MSVTPLRPNDPEPSMCALADGFRATDAANAERLIAAHGDRIRYIPAWGRWLAWDGTRWEPDADAVRVLELAKDVPRRLFRHTGDVIDSERKSLVKWATHSESANALSAAVRLARSLPGIAIGHEQLDADPYALNVTNGTIDLHTGYLHAHNPDRLLTQRANVTHRPEAQAPQFAAFLEQILPDEAVRAYLQRWVGYCLTGDITEQAIAMWWGAGRNGKSTLITILRALLGADYSTLVGRDLLMAQRFEQHPTAVAELFRARLATCSELTDAGALDEERLKAWTGGEAIQARRMRENPWTFDPTHKLVIATNHRPGARADDFAFWRRIHLVPFTVTIPAEKVDRYLAARIVDTELSGVLNWALDGCQAWQVEGLNPPEAVRAATDAYRSEADTVTRFFTEIGLTFEPGYQVVSTDLRKMHDSWAEEEGIERLGSHWRKVTARMREQGAEGNRTNAARLWMGVRLNTQSAET